jgi:hypothetical protein
MKKTAGKEMRKETKILGSCRSENQGIASM